MFIGNLNTSKIFVNSIQKTTSFLRNCDTKTSNRISKPCDKPMSNNSVAMKARANNLRFCQKFNEFKILCPVELMLISKIIPFMFIVAWNKGAQHELKVHVFLFQLTQEILSRSSRKEYLISLALKYCLSNKSAVCKQVIWPTVNNTLRKLKDINPFYRGVKIDNQGQKFSKESDPVFWNLLTNENIV